jgi:hypothetical protein
MTLHMPGDTTGESQLYTFYQQVLAALREAWVPFLIGGTYALNHHVSIPCKTKDLDLVVSPHEHHRALVGKSG